jgi:hypothetical protein
MKRCLSFLRMLLLEDDGPAHHDCRSHVLAAVGAGQEKKAGEIVDCSNWPLGRLQEWIGVGGVVELSKVAPSLDNDYLWPHALQFILTLEFFLIFRSSE